ncbi:MAG: ABC transporter ATP-binding protein, partial [Lachnospiraceae bacterium]|nr:ABC transporter ATP-binding protein [Lachnospiraceae bacterium]
MRGRSTERASFIYLKPLLSYMKKYAVMLVFTVIFAVGGTLLGVIGPRFVSRIADIILAAVHGGDVDINSVVSISIMVISFYVAAAILSYFQSFFMVTITQKTAYNLRKDINRKVNILPLRFFDSSTTGDLLSRVTNDVDTIGMTMNQSVGTLFQQGTQFIGSLFLMFITNWLLTLVASTTSL